jgi:O-antigen ligase
MLARWSALWSHRLLCAGWVIACLAVVPLTLTLHRLDLHNAPWLQDSFRHRIIIWNHTAEETLKSPIFGIGAGMMYRLDPHGVVPEEGEQWSGGAVHAHNVYLQTWFELGAIGAALLTLIGLAVLERMKRVPADVLPFAHATFASAMAMAAASYGTWQAWFIAMFEMTFIMFAIALRFATTVAPATSSPELKG